MIQIKKFEGVECPYSRSTYIINFKEELITISSSNPMENDIGGIYGVLKRDTLLSTVTLCISLCYLKYKQFDENKKKKKKNKIINEIYSDDRYMRYFLFLNASVLTINIIHSCIYIALMIMGLTLESR